jgi:hypothetical protein
VFTQRPIVETLPIERLIAVAQNAGPDADMVPIDASTVDRPAPATPVVASAGLRRTPNEPFGKNPYREGTPSHRDWADMNLWTREQRALFHAELLETMPLEEATSREWLDYGLKAVG